MKIEKKIHKLNKLMDQGNIKKAHRIATKFDAKGEALDGMMKNISPTIVNVSEVVDTSSGLVPEKDYNFGDQALLDDLRDDMIFSLADRYDCIEVETAQELEE